MAPRLSPGDRAALPTHRLALIWAFVAVVSVVVGVVLSDHTLQRPLVAAESSPDE